MFSGKYEPKLYAYYSSYSSATVRETARGGSILKSPTLLIGGLGLVVAVGWFAFGGWLSGVKPVPAAAVSKLPPPPPLPVAQGSQPVAPVPVVVPSAVRPVRIQGGMTTIPGRQGGVAVGLGRGAPDDGGRDRGRVRRHGLLAPGARRAGALWHGGALRRHAIGAGVCVGHGSFVVCGDVRTIDSTVSTAPVEPPPAAVPGGTDLLASPPGLLASPPGLLATPPGL